MNDNFDPNFNQSPAPEQIYMSDEEKKAHKSVFSRLGLAFLSYLVITNLLAILASLAIAKFAPQLSGNYNASIILSSVIQYLIALPILYLLVKKIPAKAPTVTSLGAKGFLKYGVCSIFIMYVGNYISTIIMTYMELYLGITPENSVNTLLGETNVLLSIVIVGIIGPIAEEIMFRKLFIDRLTPYGELVAILIPSLVFGLFHGNLYQFFYAFFLGAVFSFIYLRTGKIIYSTVLHIFINLFCGVLPSYIMSLFDYEEFSELLTSGEITSEYLSSIALPITLLAVYEVAMLVMIFAGLITLLRNIMKIRLAKGEVRFPKDSAADIILINVGAITLTIACVVLMALNTFAG